jgi:ParB family chromosome partitioning protein
MDAKNTPIDPRLPAPTGVDAPSLPTEAVPANAAASADLAVQMVAVFDVRDGSRHRKDMGDLASLAKSIQAVGLLHPIVVTPDRQLIAGQRRLAAVKELGWTEIPARVLDLADIIQGEHDENACRKDFTPSEKVAIGQALEELERPKAAKRKAAGRDRHRKHCKKPVAPGSGNLPEPETLPEDKGQTRDKVAAAVGMSGKTYEKAKAVVKAAEEDPERYGHLVEQMDQSGKVDPAFKQLTKQHIEANPPVENSLPQVQDAPSKNPKWRSYLLDILICLQLSSDRMRKLSNTPVPELDPAAVAQWFRRIRESLNAHERRFFADSSAEGVVSHE